MAKFTVACDIYSTPQSAMDQLQVVANRLKDKGWKIYNADYQILGWQWSPLATNNPVTFIMEKEGGSQESAEKDVKAVLYETGNYSVVGGIVAKVSAIADAGINIAEHPEDFGRGVGAGAASVVLLAAAIATGYIYFIYFRKRG